MRTFSTALAAVALVLTSSLAAQAATTSVVDPSGDGAAGTKLDVTAARLDNTQNAIKIKAAVEKVVTGAVFVYLKLEGHPRFSVLSIYDRKEGTLTNVLSQRGERVPCDRFSAAWSTSDDTIALRIPASCLAGGDYARARFKLLTEVGGDGRDVDAAPQAGDDDVWRYSAYADRG